MNQPSSPAPKKIIFILSTSYAGSHFLSLLLGSHSRTMHLGEIAGFGTAKFDAGETFFQSSNVLENLTRSDLPRIHEIIFSRIDPSVTALVDASKALIWAKSCLQNGGPHEKLFIHLIRDPRALVRRHTMSATPESRRKMRFKIARKIPPLAFSIWNAPEADLWTYRWLFENQKISSFIRRHGVKGETITYHDLATNQADEVGRLMRWADLDFEPGQLEYWNRPHIGSQKRNYDWVKEKKTQHFDLRWKTEVAPEAQQRITANRRVQEYLSGLKMKLAADGLVRAGAAYG